MLHITMVVFDICMVMLHITMEALDIYIVMLHTITMAMLQEQEASSVISPHRMSMKEKMKFFEEEMKEKPKGEQLAASVLALR